MKKWLKGFFEPQIGRGRRLYRWAQYPTVNKDIIEDERKDYLAHPNKYDLRLLEIDARRALEKGMYDGDLDLAMSGAKLYLVTGKGYKKSGYIIDKLEKTKHSAAKKKKLSRADYSRVNALVGELSDREKGSDLEKSVLAIIASVGIIGGLFLLEPIVNGNIVNSSGISSRSIFGIISFIVGVFGLYLLFRK